MENMLKILEGVYSNKELRKSIVPLFLGNPGLGKTKIIEKFAKDNNANLVEFITSQRNPFEISGMAMPDRELKKMSFWDFDTLLEMKDGDILFFDELLNGNPVVLNACLTILEHRRTISGKELPEIMIVAAANPQGAANLTPQIKERFVYYNVNYSEDMWIDYIMKKYLMPRNIARTLSNLIRKENFSTQSNFFTPRSVDKAILMLINEVPTPYKETVEPILSSFVDNVLESQIKYTENGEEAVLEPYQKVSWLKLVKIINKNK